MMSAGGGAPMSHELYTISPRREVDFHVGHIGDGRQVLLGALFSDTVAYISDAEGRLLPGSAGLGNQALHLRTSSASNSPRIGSSGSRSTSKYQRGSVSWSWKSDPLRSRNFSTTISLSAYRAFQSASSRPRRTKPKRVSSTRFGAR